MKRILFCLTAFVFATSCGPSVNPQLKAKIDGQFGAVSKKNYGAVGRFLKPMPYAVGQYVILGTTDSSGKRSISRTMIAGKADGGWIIESATLNSAEETAVQMCVRGLEKAAASGNAESVEIVWIKIKNEKGAIQRVEGPVLAMMRSVYKNNLSSLNVKAAIYVNGGTVSVPAGTFTATNRVETEVSFLGKTHRSTAWHHSAVPINGMVKMLSEDGKNQTVLLGFGFKGAVSEF
ncbi:MAG: hypothetical protein MUC76_09900 [Spirochaetes bacterium]|jgi:hypothetical protein|nr:hypothetical protein [Spirochaetota bacterium]